MSLELDLGFSFGLDGFRLVRGLDLPSWPRAEREGLSVSLRPRVRQIDFPLPLRMKVFHMPSRPQVRQSLQLAFMTSGQMKVVRRFFTCLRDLRLNEGLKYTFMALGWSLCGLGSYRRAFMHLRDIRLDEGLSRAFATLG
ncbi:hypothetical protein PanWU01x14_213640 [Parasponia andersonii]|uniref:Uncharacterized protein n=1 Tax=Parasponia andersonii TaxID=3476 RepID=A0A2P5BSS7_PARAD|nr:hypothetical protein PanWU01x14_213640 [Parasponia andersonii]